MGVDQQNLISFLLTSNQAGYTTGNERQWIKNPDKSTTISFEQDDWSAHDNFFGGEPYGGRLVVFYKKEPVWIMVYYGWVAENVEVDPVYIVLRNALKRMPKTAPFRGPKKYEKEEYTYENIWDGNVQEFSGKETISLQKHVIYSASYMGGLVDQRAGL